MLNPFFQQGSKSEQNLLQDLINEQLRMYGVEVHYLPRKYATESSVLREVIQSVFDDAYPIEAYVDNYEGYDDNTTILSKFGIQTTQEINLIISKERWETYVSPLIKNETNIKLSNRPKEGDLIYFPLGDKLFEIKFVEYQKPFYQLQKNYVYELRCELFRIGDEVIDTGVDAIDDVLVAGESDGLSEDGVSTVVAGSQTLTLVGTSSTATAITNVVNGGIRSISISNQGAYYPLAPTVAISSAPSSGITGIATVILDRTALKAVHLTNAGAGYTVAPEVSFITTNGIGGTAQSLIGDGAIGIITVTSGGAGYTTTPLLHLPESLLYLLLELQYLTVVVKSLLSTSLTLVLVILKHRQSQLLILHLLALETSCLMRLSQDPQVVPLQELELGTLLRIHFKSLTLQEHLQLVKHW